MELDVPLAAHALLKIPIQIGNVPTPCRPGCSCNGRSFDRLKVHEVFHFILKLMIPEWTSHCVQVGASAGELVLNTGSGRGHVVLVTLPIGPFLC